MNKILILALGLFFFLSGCNKPLLKYNNNFEGTWYSEPVFNTTYSDWVSDQLVFSGSNGTYYADCKDTCAPVLCNCITSISGKAEINKQRTLIRINGNSVKTFNLNAEPYQNASGTWMMEIDNKTYTKQ